MFCHIKLPDGQRERFPTVSLTLTKPLLRSGPYDFFFSFMQVCVLLFKKKMNHPAATLGSGSVGVRKTICFLK